MLMRNGKELFNQVCTGEKISVVGGDTFYENTFFENIFYMASRTI